MHTSSRRRSTPTPAQRRARARPSGIPARPHPLNEVPTANTVLLGLWTGSSSEPLTGPRVAAAPTRSTTSAVPLEPGLAADLSSGCEVTYHGHRPLPPGAHTRSVSARQHRTATPCSEMMAPIHRLEGPWSDHPNTKMASPGASTPETTCRSEGPPRPTSATSRDADSAPPRASGAPRRAARSRSDLRRSDAALRAHRVRNESQRTSESGRRHPDRRGSSPSLWSGALRCRPDRCLSSPDPPPASAPPRSRGGSGAGRMSAGLGEGVEG